MRSDTIMHHVQIVRDEDIAHLPLGLQIGQQIEDRRLHRHVERRGRLIADHHLRAAGEGAGDGDPLLQPAGQLTRLRVEMPRRPAAPRRSAREAAPLVAAPVQSDQAQRAADQPAHRLRAVERRAGILEDDLQRFDLSARAIVRRAPGSGSPSSSIRLPASGVDRPSSSLASELLPLPDSPTRPSVSPGHRSSATS